MGTVQGIAEEELEAAQHITARATVDALDSPKTRHEHLVHLGNLVLLTTGLLEDEDMYLEEVFHAKLRQKINDSLLQAGASEHEAAQAALFASSEAGIEQLLYIHDFESAGLVPGLERQDKTVDTNMPVFVRGILSAAGQIAS